MIFFTDITTNASNYCLLNIKRYHDKRKAHKILCFIDPSVYELKDRGEFSKITDLHALAQGGLLPNEYLSIDYPCDMNEALSEEFIAKSNANNLRYADNLQYICTVQSKFQDFLDFRLNWEYLENEIIFMDKIIGIGNLCRIMRPNAFTENVIQYIIDHTSAGQWVHFYGLSLALMRRYIPMLEENGLIISVDSTKWTKAVNNTLKLAHGVCARKDTRDLFFLEYIKKIEEFAAEVVY